MGFVLRGQLRLDDRQDSYLVDGADHAVDQAGVDRGAVEEGWLPSDTISGVQDAVRMLTLVSLTTTDQVGGCYCQTSHTPGQTRAETYLAYDKAIFQVEVVDRPRVEDVAPGGHTRGHVVGLHDGMVCRVELEQDNVADGRRDVVRHVLMGVLARADLDGMCSTGRRGRRRGRR